MNVEYYLIFMFCCARRAWVFQMEGEKKDCFNSNERRSGRNEIMAKNLLTTFYLYSTIQLNN